MQDSALPQVKQRLSSVSMEPYSPADHIERVRMRSQENELRESPSCGVIYRLLPFLSADVDSAPQIDVSL